MLNEALLLLDEERKAVYASENEFPKRSNMVEATSGSTYIPLISTMMATMKQLHHYIASPLKLYLISRSREWARIKQRVPTLQRIFQ